MEPEVTGPLPVALLPSLHRRAFSWLLSGGFPGCSYHTLPGRFSLPRFAYIYIQVWHHNPYENFSGGKKSVSWMHSYTCTYQPMKWYRLKAFTYNTADWQNSVTFPLLGTSWFWSFKTIWAVICGSLFSLFWMFRDPALGWWLSPYFTPKSWLFFIACTTSAFTWKYLKYLEVSFTRFC